MQPPSAPTHHRHLFPRLLTVLAMLAACGGIASVAATAAPKPKVTASFLVEPARPLVGQVVRFGSTSKVTSGVATIVRHEWDLDGNGSFETHTGAVPAAARSYSAAGTIAVSLRVTDSREKQGVVTQALVVRNRPAPGPPPPPNRPASASFIFSPTAPAPGQTITFASTSTDPENAIAESSWDLNGDGLFGDALGPVAVAGFPAPGSRTVSLRVTDAGGARSFDTQTVTVAAPGGAPGQVEQKSGAVVSLMNPFPVVRMAGHYTAHGVRIRLFTVSAPSGAKVTARCSGRGCPFQRKRVAPRRSRAQTAKLLHVRSLERRLPAGVRLVITVTKQGQIGKYTLFKVRSGRPPTRLDRCLVPGSSRPRRCNTLSFLP